MPSKSTVLIIPAAMRDAGNAVAEEMGWGPNNYSVALTDGAASPTHYGLHRFACETFEGWVTGTEPLPDGMDHAQAVIDALIYSFSDEIRNREHFNAVLTANDLAVWSPPQE